MPGDLDPQQSPHHLTTMKKAYLKLRFLVDAGCILVGHDLRNDFRLLNIVVPVSQVGLMGPRQAAPGLRVPSASVACLKLGALLSTRLMSSMLLLRRLLAVKCCLTSAGQLWFRFVMYTSSLSTRPLVSSCMPSSLDKLLQAGAWHSCL